METNNVMLDESTLQALTKRYRDCLARAVYHREVNINEVIQRAQERSCDQVWKTLERGKQTHRLVEVADAFRKQYLNTNGTVHSPNALFIETYIRGLGQ